MPRKPLAKAKPKASATEPSAEEPTKPAAEETATTSAGEANAENNSEIPSRLGRFLSHTWVSALGWACTVVSVPLAFYFFLASQADRRLTFAEAPIRAIIYKAGETSDLAVNFHGKEIKGDMGATQIAIWNDGKLPIRPEHILKTIRIVLEPRCEILQVKIAGDP